MVYAYPCMLLTSFSNVHNGLARQKEHFDHKAFQGTAMSNEQHVSNNINMPTS